MLVLCQYSMGSRGMDYYEMYLTGGSGKPGQDVELTINLRCHSTSDWVCGYSCVVYLPEGFTLKKFVRITDRGGQEIFQSVKTSDGGTMLTALNYGAQGIYEFTGQDGPVAKMVVSVSEDVALGEYEVKLNKITLTDAGGGTSFPVNSSDSFNLWITSNPNTDPGDDPGVDPGVDPTPANIFYMTAPNGRVGQTAQLTLNIKNSEPIQGWACHLYLPKGVEYKSVSVNSSSRYELEPYIDVRNTSVDGVPDGGKQIAIVCYTKEKQIKFKPLFGEDGAVATVTVSVSNSVTPGEHVIGIRNISLSSPDGESLSVNKTADFSWMIFGSTPLLYTINFDTDGGSPIESITQEYGSSITPPANPTKEGYTFLGWEPEIPATMTQNMTVKAKWAVKSYTLTYIVDGEVYKTSSVAYGTTIMPEAAPTKEGYTFSGWSEIPATMPAHDVTVTGTFTYDSDTDVSDLDNVVYIDNVEGFVGQQLTLSVKMKNTVGIQTVQFDLCLPEGVTVAKDEDGFDLIELSTERTTAKKMDSFSSSQVSGGSYRVLINSNRGYTFDGEDGEIALVTVTIDPEMQEGDYPIYLRDIVLVNTSSEGYETEYVKSTLTVSAYTPGDVNGDGKVNAIDLNAIVNYILEHRNFLFTFVEKAADLNADSKINAIDVNALTNMILRGDAPQSAKKQMPIMVGTLEER